MLGINDAGQIIGRSTTLPGSSFLYSGGVYTTISVPGVNGPYDETSLADINDSGQIVGTAAGRGFLYSGGIYTTIDFPGSFDSSAVGINDSSQIIGNYGLNRPLNNEYGFLDSGGIYTTIVPPGLGVTSEIIGINNSGEIIGEAFKPTVTPLPPSWIMILTGLVGLGFIAYGRKKENADLARTLAA